MWLKKLVAVSLIVTATAMFGISVTGLIKGAEQNSNLNNSGKLASEDSNSPQGIGTEIAPAVSASSSSSDQTAAINSGEQPAATAASPTPGASTTVSATTTPSPGATTTPAPAPSGGATPPSGGSPAPATPKPVVNITVSPGTITAGGSATIGWSATNSASSCTASGSWSGTKGASGSQSTGAVPSAGTRTYSITCSNAGGSATASVNLAVNAAPVAYCGGIDPNTCFGVSAMNAHNTSTNCWGYTKYNRSGAYASVFNLNAASPGSKISTTHGLKGISSGNFYSKCGQDITSCVNGSGGCGGWRNHSTNHMNSYSQTFIGYYDPAKP